MTREFLMHPGHDHDREAEVEVEVEPPAGWPGKRAASANLPAVRAHDALTRQREVVVDKKRRARELVMRAVPPATLHKVDVQLSLFREGGPRPTAVPSVLRALVDLELRDHELGQKIARRDAANAARQGSAPERRPEPGVGPRLARLRAPAVAARGTRDDLRSQAARIGAPESRDATVVQSQSVARAIPVVPEVPELPPLRARPPGESPTRAPREPAVAGSSDVPAARDQGVRATPTDVLQQRRIASEEELNAATHRAFRVGAPRAPLARALPEHGKTFHPEVRPLVAAHAAALVAPATTAKHEDTHRPLDPRGLLARLRGEPESPRSPKLPDPGIVLPGTENTPYEPLSDDAPALPQRAYAGGHGGGFPKPPEPPPLPPKESTRNQQVLDGYVLVARTARQAARDAVKDQQRTKCAQVSVDGAALTAQVKEANTNKLRALRLQNEQQKIAADAAKAEAAKGPVTVESLREKLEVTAKTDRDRADQLYETKRRELKLRMDTERELLRDQTEKQLQNISVEQNERKQQVEHGWRDEKAKLDKHTEGLVVLIRKGAEAEQQALEAKKDKIFEASNKRAEQVKSDADDKAGHARRRGNKLAHDLKKQAYKDADAKYAEARSVYQMMVQNAEATAPFLPEDQRAAYLLQQRWNATRAEGADQAARGRPQGQGRPRGVRGAPAREEGGRDDPGRGERERKKVDAAAQSQIEATTKKVDDIKPLADAQIKKTGDELKKQLDEGEKHLAEQLTPNRQKIRELRKQGEEKIAKAEGDAEKQLATEHDAS
ncbi:MAG: hypothetical protein IPQ07_30590 [Myxococcales bacterium]|nr:hypothetical protein [Myxococcales bacterium]